MSGWRETTTAKLIAEGALKIGDGYRAKNNELAADGLPFARAGNINNGFLFSGADCLPYHYTDIVGDKASLPGDTVFTSKGTVGRFGFVTERTEKFVYSPQLCFWRSLKHEEVLPRFVYYWMHGQEFLGQVEGLKGQTDMADYVNLADQRRMTITLPSPPEQKAIATVLSSLDDKIDLLHRQNKTLEAMAETLFRQWFVEEAQEAWEEVALEDVTSRITDGAHASPPTVEVGLPMASVKDMYQWGINTETCRQISQDDFDELVRTDCRPLKNDILIAKDGSYLKHVFVAENDMDVVILSSIAILRPNGKYHPLLLAIFLRLDSTRESLENIVTGAVIPRIVLKDFRKYKLLLPPKPLQDKAVAVIEPLFEKCWGNNRQIRTLETLRDTLLPKLMSGEVRVNHEGMAA